MRNINRSRGVASVLALLLLAVFMAVSVSLFALAGTSVAQADNTRDVLDARLVAESGLAFMTNRMNHSGVPSYLRGTAMLNSLASKLSVAITSSNRGGAAITYDGTTIRIPAISMGAGRSFTATVTSPSYEVVRVTVTGIVDDGGRNITRTISLDYAPTGNPAFGYGLASEGPISMGMNTEFTGTVSNFDGSMYSAAQGTAISIGSGYISGDVCTSATGATVSLGKADAGGNVYRVPPIAMPGINRTPYGNLTTSVVTTAGLTLSGTFKNLRVKANTNPSFGSSTIMGVLYIEAPNHIEFKNNANITGVIVADDPPAGTPDANAFISFWNNVTFHGVQDLPATSEFTEVRKLQGSCVLAPGFTMEFKNNMGGSDGVIALKKLDAKNNLTSVIYGSILIYGTGGLSFVNNTDMTIDRSGQTSVPAGFSAPAVPFAAQPSTYSEQ
jgi:hypothetical protein